MLFQEFLEKWNGTYIEVAGTSAKNQCVDLANLFIRDFLGLPIIEYTNAKDFPSKADKNIYDYILNTPTGVPQEGDLVIWGGTYGHIAIFIEGNSSKFISFDQNFPAGSPCHIQNHTYSGCLGWLRFKKDNLPPSPELQKCLKDLDQERTWKNETHNELQEVTTELESVQSQVTTHQEFQKQIAITLKVENQPSNILGEIMKLIKLEDQLREEQRKSSTYENTLAGKGIEIEQLEKTMVDATLENKSLLDTKEKLTREITVLSEKIKKLEKAKRLNILFKVFGLYICGEKKEEVKEKNDPS